MPEYFVDIEYNNSTFTQQEANFKEFECCTFSNCNFSQCVFVAVTFIDCTFNNCIFNEAKINYAAFRTVIFNQCVIKDVNFAMCDKFIFEIAFNDCILDFSKFYTLKLKKTTFTNCSLIAVDFMSTDLTEVVFDNCDLYRAEFAKATASKASFKTSRNFSIDPTTTKIKKAIFTMQGLTGLLDKYDIIIQ